MLCHILSFAKCILINKIKSIPTNFFWKNPLSGNKSAAITFYTGASALCVPVVSLQTLNYKRKLTFDTNNVNEFIMDNEKLRQFIAMKIGDMQSAIFYCHSNSQLHINNTIINSSIVDHNGRVMFFINRPHQLLSHFDQEFPVALNYFRKGKNYFMKILGEARIINDPEELAYYSNLTDEEKVEAQTTKALVAVTISKVDFHDTNYEQKNPLSKKFWSLSSSLFDWFGSVSRSYYVG